MRSLEENTGFLISSEFEDRNYQWGGWLACRAVHEEVKEAFSHPKDEVDTAGPWEPLSGGTCFSGAPAAGIRFQELFTQSRPADVNVAARSVLALFGARHPVGWLLL